MTQFVHFRTRSLFYNPHVIMGGRIHRNMQPLLYLKNVLYKYIYKDSQRAEALYTQFLDNNNFYIEYLECKKNLDNYYSALGDEIGVLTTLNSLEQILIKGDFIIEMFYDYSKYCNKFGMHFDQSEKYLLRIKETFPFLNRNLLKNPQ